MRIAVLDDEAFYSNKIAEIIHMYDPFDTIDMYNCASALLQAEKTYDLLLLDIEMPEINGIEFVQSYASLFPNILFVSSYDQYVFHAFLPNVRGFVVKDQMENTLIPKLQQIKKQKNSMIIFHTDIGMIEAASDHIQYFYTEDTFIYLVTLTKKYSLTYKSLKQLPIDYHDYFYISRGYLVKIKSILELQKTHTSIKVKNKDVLKVSRRNWKDLVQAYVRGI